MSKGEFKSIRTEEAPVRVSSDGEKRIYYLFSQIDCSHPYELIITEMPAGIIQDYHKHNTIVETTVVLKGEATAIEKKNDGTTEKTCIKSLSFYDPEIYDFHTIVAAEDGTLLFVLYNRQTKDYCGGELPYDEGFTAKNSEYHTIQNTSDSMSILATIKATSSDILTNNPNIFKEDKIVLEK